MQPISVIGRSLTDSGSIKNVQRNSRVAAKLECPEKLAKRSGIDPNVETIRRWMLSEAIQTFYETTQSRRVLAPDAQRLQSAFLHRTASWVRYPAPVHSPPSEVPNSSLSAASRPVSERPSGNRPRQMVARAGD